MEGLMAIQSELKCSKNQYNSFGKYKYRSAEDILEAVKPLCKKHKCLLTLSDEIVCVYSRWYVRATATFIDKDDRVHEVTAYAREDEQKKGMDGSQITGTASSYARKYALNGLFLIDDTKDADTDSYREQQENAPKPKKLTTAHAKEIKDALAETDSNVPAFLSIFNAKDVDSMLESQYDKAMHMLEKKRAQKGATA